MRVLGDSGKSRLAFGLTLYVLFVFALALRLGILPDGPTAVREGRASLCEAVAVNAAILLGQNDLIQLEHIMAEIVRHDDHLESAGVRRADGELLVEAGEHQAAWREVSGVHSTDTQVQVPLGSEDQTWGSLEVRFRPSTRPGTWRSNVPPLMPLFVFVGVACFVGFRSFLGTLRASPSDPVASTRDQR